VEIVIKRQKKWIKILSGKKFNVAKKVTTTSGVDGKKC
jgi:hypothetical protein